MCQSLELIVYNRGWETIVCKLRMVLHFKIAFFFLIKRKGYLVTHDNLTKINISMFVSKVLWTPSRGHLFRYCQKMPLCYNGRAVTEIIMVHKAENIYCLALYREGERKNQLLIDSSWEAKAKILLGRKRKHQEQLLNSNDWNISTL